MSRPTRKHRDHRRRPGRSKGRRGAARKGLPRIDHPDRQRSRRTPYERPPLSKAYLAGQAPFEDALVHPLPWYGEHDVDLRLSTTATAFDKDGHTVTLSDGTTLTYDKLLLATGAIPRVLKCARRERGQRAVPTSSRRRRLDPCDVRRRPSARDHRCRLDRARGCRCRPRREHRSGHRRDGQAPLLGVLGPEIAQMFADLHADHGVRLCLGAELAEITVEDGRASGVRLADGTMIPPMPSSSESASLPMSRSPKRPA